MPNTSIDQSTALILADREQRPALYQRMCAAIAECAEVDEVREIRNRAKALEEYTKQSKNYEAEVQLSAIRVRAERRAGELLIEMAEKGERAVSGGDQKASYNNNTMLLKLADLGVTRVESSHWQQVAKMPAPEFEEAIAKPGIKRTAKIIAAYNPPKKRDAPLARQAVVDAMADDRQSLRPLHEAAIKLADGKVRSPREIAEVTDRDFKSFLKRARILPWLHIERTGGGYRFTVDEELRAICEDHAPRPQLNGASVRSFVRRLVKEIYRRREENGENQRGNKWNPDNILKVEQMKLIVWIQSELTTLDQLLTASGPDSMMSEARIQHHPIVDEKDDTHVFQERHEDRATDSRPC